MSNLSIVSIPNQILSVGQEVLTKHSFALSNMASSLEQTGFTDAVDLLVSCTGHVVVCGVGKCAHISSKIVDAFTAIGVASFSIYDENIEEIGDSDIIMVISYSGENAEIIPIIELASRKNLKTIAVTGNKNSYLANSATVTIEVNGNTDNISGPLSSIFSNAVMLGIGDALAMALTELNGIKRYGVSKIYPMMNIDKLLEVTVDEIMITDEQLPTVGPACSLLEAIEVMNQKPLGFVAVVNKFNKLIGIFTDGDLRRTLLKTTDIENLQISDAVMSYYPKIIDYGIISSTILAIDALVYLNSNRITSLLVVNEDRILIGALHLHDLLKVGFTE